MNTQTKSESSEKQDYSAPKLNVVKISDTAGGGALTPDALGLEGLPS